MNAHQPTGLRVFVAGHPATQGSSRAFVVPATRSTKARAIITGANNTRLKPWREAVRSTVTDWIRVNTIGDWEPLTGPIGIEVVFALPKPASAPKRRRTWPTGARTGDIDKLTRAVMDGLADAGFYRNDAQVIHQAADKDYGTRLGVHIHAWAITDTDDM